MEGEISYLALFLSWLPMLVLFSPIIWLCISINNYARTHANATKELAEAMNALVSSNQQLIQSLQQPAEDNELGTS